MTIEQTEKKELKFETFTVLGGANYLEFHKDRFRSITF